MVTAAGIDVGFAILVAAILLAVVITLCTRSLCEAVFAITDDDVTFRVAEVEK